MIQETSVGSDPEGPAYAPFECGNQGSQKCKLRIKRGLRISSMQKAMFGIHWSLFTGRFKIHEVIFRSAPCNFFANQKPFALAGVARNVATSQLLPT